MIELLIYDLDGTLIDSKQDIANAVNWTLGELGLPRLPLDRISAFVGSGVAPLISNVLNESGSGEAAAETFLDRAVALYRSRYAEHLLDETKLFPSVETVLRHFKTRKQAVITNKPVGFSHQILQGLGVDHYFFRVTGGDQSLQKKPSPEPVLATVKAAGVRLEETVFIGDSTIDIETGKNAGVQTVAVTYGFRKRDQIEKSKPDFILDDLVDLMRCPLLIETRSR